MKKQFTFSIIILLLMQSCDYTESDREKSSEELISRDMEFSEYSQKHGIGKAFVEFADSAAVLLKPDRMPIKGSISIYYHYSSLEEDENYKLSWMPLDAIVSKSEDLGYTYGIWQLSSADSSANGTYVTIWKKDDDGLWKYVLDSGNEGIGMKK